MAMQYQLWSINALSVELEMDRRTLAKRLSDLPPAEINGTRKRYKLVDVLKHLNSDASKRKLAEEANAALFQEFKDVFSQDFYPKACEISFAPVMGLLEHQHGMSKKEAVKAYQGLSSILAYVIEHYFQDEGMRFEVPEIAEEIHMQGIDEFVKKNYGEAA